jgi:hypothetical protein
VSDLADSIIDALRAFCEAVFYGCIGGLVLCLLGV